MKKESFKHGLKFFGKSLLMHPSSMILIFTYVAKIEFFSKMDLPNHFQKKKKKKICAHFVTRERQPAPINQRRMQLGCNDMRCTRIELPRASVTSDWWKPGRRTLNPPISTRKSFDDSLRKGERAGEVFRGVPLPVLACIGASLVACNSSRGEPTRIAQRWQWWLMVLLEGDNVLECGGDGKRDNALCNDAFGAHFIAYTGCSSRLSLIQKSVGRK